jgi:ABC-type multidrug transport system fused ATPase/permease subunit
LSEQSVLASGFHLVREVVGRHPLPFLVSVVGAAVAAGGTVGSTVVLGRITDQVVDPAFADSALTDPGSTDSGIVGATVTASTVAWAIAAVFAVTWLRVVGTVFRRYYAGMTSERGQRTLRRHLTDKYIDLPLTWHHEVPAGRLLAHADNDAEISTELIHPLPFSLGVVFLALFSAVSLLAIDLWMALVGFLIFPALTVLNQVYSKRVEQPAAEVQASVGEVSSIAHESFDGALVVKTLGRAGAEGHRFARSAYQLRENRVRVGYLRAVFEAIMDALPSLGIVAVVVFGAYRIGVGAITRGDLVQVAALFTVLSLPMRVLGFFLETIPRSVVARRRLDMVFDEPDPDPVDDAETLPDGPLSLTVRDLTYRYPAPSPSPASTGDANGVDSDHGSDGANGVDSAHGVGDAHGIGGAGPVLHNVSLAIQPGQVVALVGSTGSGKSTLCHLVSGLIPPTEGEIEVGGRRLSTLEDDERTGAVALVFQESFLFADTLRSNIDVDGSATDEALRSAAAVAQVDEFVAELPAGFDTVVGERGVTLSGGQRQRVALARALIRRPRLLLLDDATSAVDPRVEQQILAGLRTAGSRSPTTLIVAQRVSTIELADRVLYLADGRIAGDGTHQEMMAIPGYAALVKAYEAASR